MYNFDEIINRTNTNCLSVDWYKEFLINKELPYKDEDLIYMWIADMQFGVASEIVEGIKKALDNKILGYTRVCSNDYYDSFLLWCKNRYDFTFKKEELVLSHGIVPAVQDIISYLCKEDDQVLYMTPAYGHFKIAVDANNIKSVYSKMINNDGYYTIDYDNFEELAKDSKTKVFIFCNPQNPTGRVHTLEELEKVAKIIKKYNLWVISDEIHCDILRKNQKHIPLGKVMSDYDRLISCYSASKTFNIAGMMISNILIRNNELREIWLSKHENADNPLSVAASLSAYKDGYNFVSELTDYLDENFRYTEEFLNKNLPLTNFRVSEATYLGWIDLNAYLNDIDLIEFFAINAGVLLEASNNMFVDNAMGFVRLNLALPKSLLVEALNRMFVAISNYIK